MALIYRIGIRLYYFAIWIASFFNAKASKWIVGRRGWEQRYRQEFGKHRKEKWIWMHCASLGEFEQGRPILEQLRDRHPNIGVVLSFFSPSGYEIRKDTPLADVVGYLPIDTPSNARKWIDVFSPDLAIFVKYEFWYFHLYELKEKNIPVILISAIFRPEQVFFKWYGIFFRKILNSFHHLFVQDKASMELIQQQEIPNVVLAGDTRVDRVLSIHQQDYAFPKLKTFCADRKLFIFGSTHPADEAVIVPFLNQLGTAPDWAFIIAPHEINESALTRLEDSLGFPCVRYSELKEDNQIKNTKCILIDNIGMLARLYALGDLAYIGGGFGRGIHNILEPMAFSLPVIFGPHYHKFEEAKKLVATSGGFSVNDTAELHKVFQKLEDPSFYMQASAASYAYLKANRGATKIIMEFLEDLLPLSAYDTNT